MDFITGVNRLLRIEHILSGQDDDITSFSDSQHQADVTLAQLAIQDEIIELSSDQLLDYEHTTSSVTLVTGTRTYNLAAGFVRFFGEGSFYDSVINTRYYEWVGGEQDLMNEDYQYKTVQGTPSNWYWNSTTTKSVAFYPVPDSSSNSRIFTYDYEGSVLVTNSTDTLPFPNNEEAFSFIACAARRFHYMRMGKELGVLPQDATYSNAKARLSALMRPTNPSEYYGKSYC